MRTYATAVALGLATTLACSEDPGPTPPGPAPDTRLPLGVAVQTVSPVPQSLSAGRRSNLSVVFDRPVQAPSGNPADLIRVFGRWSGAVAGNASLSADRRTLTFAPSREFSAGEWVAVTLIGPMGTEQGGTLLGSYNWGFWARADPGTLALTASAVIPLRRPAEGHIQAYGSYAGDLNGDGYPDLMIPNEITNDIRVLLNDGSGDYSGMTTYAIPGGARPSTNEGADFDDDGLTDFAVGNSGGALMTVFRGTGGGTFVHMGNYQGGQGIRGLCVLDLDGDGDVDVVTANRVGGAGNGDVSLFINDGSGRFGPGLALETGSSGETACAAADADGDGILDIFIGAIHSREMVLLTGDGQGNLPVRRRIPAGGGPWMVAVGDVDGDGAVDVVSANFDDNTVSVILGDGAGGMTLAMNYAVGSNPIAIDLGDIDGDGDLDLVASNFGDATWTVLENDGLGRFGNSRTLNASSAGSCAVLVDIDNDGDLDMVGIDEIDDLLFVFRNQ